MIVTRLVPLFLFIGLSAALTLTRNPNQNQNTGPTICGGELTGRNGSIRSPGYPDRYPNNVHCEWSIPQPEPGHSTYLRFATMYLEQHLDCSSDYVEIKEVKDDEDVVLGRFCGSDVYSRTIVSKDPIKVTFHSDMSAEYNGFQLDWAKSEDGPACGGIFIASQAIISSPNTTDPNETRECEWIVISRSGKHTRFEITILSKNENPDCEHDYYSFKMQVLPGGKDPAEIPYVPMYIHACNHEKTWVLTSPGPQTRITFQPDSNHTLAGFVMSYSTVEE